MDPASKHEGAELRIWGPGGTWGMGDGGVKGGGRGCCFPSRPPAAQRGAQGSGAVLGDTPAGLGQGCGLLWLELGVCCEGPGSLLRLSPPS